MSTMPARLSTHAVTSLTARFRPYSALHHDIGSKTDFFHVDGTSLLLVNLQSLLKRKYVNAPPLHKLFEASTLEGMASFAEHAEVEVPVQHINWELEADLLPNEVYASTRPSSTNDLRLAPPHQVALTGATGFLGKKMGFMAQISGRRGE